MIYRLERYDAVQDSRRTRKIVSHLLAGYDFESIKSGVPQNASICSSVDGAFAFYHYPVALVSDFSAKEGTKLQFYRYGGRWVFGKKTAVIPVAQLGKDISVTCENSKKGCLFSGGDVSSNFEGNESISLGWWINIGNNYVESGYYINNRTHDLICTPM